MKYDSLAKLSLGLGTGAVFGFLLQKGQAGKYDKMTGALRLRDADLAKIMGTASAVGAVGSQLLQRAGHVEADIKPLKLGGVLMGGALFGTGMALLGHCPGTSVAAAGEGNRDAALGVVGMFLGAMAYVKLLPRIKPLIDKGDLGEKTVAELIRDARDKSIESQS